MVQEDMRRPGSVTIVVVLTWLQALAAIAIGIGLIAVSDETLAEVDVDPDTAGVTGIVEIAIGLGIIALAILLGKGANFARVLVSLIMVIRLGLSVWTVVALFGTAWMWFSAAAGLFALLILILLWNGSANRYFAR